MKFTTTAIAIALAYLGSEVTAKGLGDHREEKEGKRGGRRHREGTVFKAGAEAEVEDDPEGKMVFFQSAAGEPVTVSARWSDLEAGIYDTVIMESDGIDDCFDATSVLFELGSSFEPNEYGKGGFKEDRADIDLEAVAGDAAYILGKFGALVDAGDNIVACSIISRCGPDPADD